MPELRPENAAVEPAASETASPPCAPRFQDLTLSQVPKEFRGRPRWFIQFWLVVEGTLFRLSPLAVFPWRAALLRLFGARIGRNVRIRPTVRVTYPWKLTVGDNVWIGDDCVIYNLADVTIGSHVALAHKVYLCTGHHDISRIDFPIGASPIVIQDECWLANDVFVAPGVTIGRGAVVGARSTVLHTLPGAMVCYGYPAKPVKARTVPDVNGHP